MSTNVRINESIRDLNERMTITLPPSARHYPDRIGSGGREIGIDAVHSALLPTQRCRLYASLTDRAECSTAWMKRPLGNEQLCNWWFPVMSPSYTMRPRCATPHPRLTSSHSSASD